MNLPNSRRLRARASCLQSYISTETRPVKWKIELNVIIDIVTGWNSDLKG